MRNVRIGRSHQVSIATFAASVIALGFVSATALGVAFSTELTASEETPLVQDVGVRPDVLLVTIDTLRADALGSYGGRAATPALDALAASGTRFEYVAAHAVVTLPAHTSILTGLDPSRHGVHDNTGYRASDRLVTWAERFRDAGYATGAFVGAFPVDSMFGLAQGFDVYDDYYGESGSMGDFAIVERPAAEVVGVARRWLRRQRGPWFAWVHLYDPHTPYEPPNPFDTEYESAPYAGEVAATDVALAPLLDDARRSGTIVIVTGDHGEALGDHGEITHGVFAYDATLRVPLIVAWPDELPGDRVVSDPVHHVDLLPTALELTDLDGDASLQGASLVPLLRGTGSVPGTPGGTYFESLTTYLARNWAPLRGIYEGRWKLIDLPVAELYDTDSDPGEQENLIDREPDRARRMRGALERHLAVVDDVAAPRIEDAETLARLQALGYVGGGGDAPAAREFGPEDDPKNLIDLDNMVQEAAAAGRRGEYARATELLEVAIERRPDFTHAHTLLAFVESQRGDVDAAIDRLYAALDGGLENTLLLTRLGTFLRNAGRHDDAVEVLERARSHEPDSLEILNLLGAEYDEAGSPEQAVAVFEHALDLDPTYPTLLANHANLLLRLGRLDEARQVLEAAIEYDPNLGVAHNKLGVIAAQQDRLPEAVEHWRTAVGLDPGQFDALMNLGIGLTRLNRFAEAIPVLEAFVERAPEARYADDLPGMRRLLQRLRER